MTRVNLFYLSLKYIHFLCSKWVKSTRGYWTFDYKMINEPEHKILDHSQAVKAVDGPAKEQGFCF